MSEPQVEYQSFPPAPEAQTRYKTSKQSGGVVALVIFVAIVFMVVAGIIQFVGNQHLNKAIIKHIDPNPATQTTRG